MPIELWNSTNFEEGRAKVNEVVEQTNRQTRAIETMATWLVQAQTGFNSKDAEGIFKILRGEQDAE